MALSVADRAFTELPACPVPSGSLFGTEMGEADRHQQDPPGLKHRPSLLSFHSVAEEDGAAAEATAALGSSGLVRVRWLVLLLSCWIMFGNYYAFDNPSALNRSLRRTLAPLGDEELFQYRFGLLYSVYSVPNVLLPFFVGRWLDRWGTGIILAILSSLVTGGQLVVALGVGRESFPLILAGRVLFGVGGESLAVAQTRVVTDWFQDRELALAIGLNLSIARIGTVVNNVVSPWIARRWHSVAAAFWVGLASCAISLVCTVATIWVDTRYRRLHRHHRHSRAASIDGTADASATEPAVLASTSATRVRANFHSSFWILSLICFLFYVRCLTGGERDPTHPMLPPTSHAVGMYDSVQQCGLGLLADPLLHQ